jgi:cell pole-organizing protein PopZ
MVNESDDSIDEILKSIKKFVSIDEKPNGEEQTSSDDYVFSRDGIIKLPQIHDVDSNIAEKGSIDMPDFIKKANQQYQLQQLSSSDKPSQDKASTVCLQKLDSKQETKTILKNFADVVKECSKNKEIFNKNGSLDQLVLDVIKTTVSSWIEGNIKQIVENLVKEEIKTITNAILSPGVSSINKTE